MGVDHGVSLRGRLSGEAGGFGMTDERGQVDLEESGLLDAYRRGRPDGVERVKEGSTVLSVRLPRDVLRELTRLARAQNRPVGRVARELIEAGLASTEGANASVVLRA